MPRTATLTTPKKEIFNMTATKAVIYARYSSHNQREESIEGQLRECHEYAEKTIDLIEKELKDTSVLVSLRDKLKDVNRRIKNLMSAIEQGIITFDISGSNTITIRSSDINGAVPLYQSYPNSLFFVKGCFGYVFQIEEV